MGQTSGAEDKVIMLSAIAMCNELIVVLPMTFRTSAEYQMKLCITLHKIPAVVAKNWRMQSRFQMFLTFNSREGCRNSLVLNATFNDAPCFLPGGNYG